MTWPIYAALPVLAGFPAYLCYLLFLLVIFLKEGAAGVEKVAKVVPAPKWWVKSIAKAITSWRAGGITTSTDSSGPRDGE